MAEAIGVVANAWRAPELSLLSPTLTEVQEVASKLLRDVPTHNFTKNEIVVASTTVAVSLMLLMLARSRIPQPPRCILTGDALRAEVDEIFASGENNLEHIQSVLARTKELQRSDLTTKLEKVLARVQRYIDRQSDIVLGSMNQFHPTIQEITKNPCRFCAYRFIEKMLTGQPTITKEWIDDLLKKASEDKRAANISDPIYFAEDVTNYYNTSTSLEEIPGAKTRYDIAPTNASLDDTPIQECTNFLTHWLNVDNLGVMATFHCSSFAIVRKSGCYYLFDSHGALNSLNRKEACVLPFKNLEDLAEFLVTFHYPVSKDLDHEAAIIAFQQEDCELTFESVRISFEKHFNGMTIPEDDYNSFIRHADPNNTCQAKGNLARNRLGIRFDRNLLEIVPLRVKNGSKKI
ncbi:MAG: hypothetical protein SNF33_07770 [Candidatus Algichlamydia australiensis]|nr:hypothetical protein [Chlamydiales bacterium]